MALLICWLHVIATECNDSQSHRMANPARVDCHLQILLAVFIVATGPKPTGWWQSVVIASTPTLALR